MPTASATQHSSINAAHSSICAEAAELLPLDTLPTYSLKNKALKHLHLLLYRSGLSSLYARAQQASPATIVMYHSIPAPPEVVWIDPCNCLSAERFEQQIRFLANSRHVISIEQLTRQLENGEPLRRGTVAITLDDGYRNNLTVAAPILAKYHLPATLYLATNYIDKGENQWIDTLYSAFMARSHHQLTLSMPKAQPGQLDDQGDHTSKWNLAHKAERQAAYSAIVSYLIEASVAQKQQLLTELNAQLAPTIMPPRLTLSWDEVRQLQQQYPNITLGVHTANHLDLSQHPEQTTQEIQTAVQQIEDATGTSPEHLAFPYNRYNHRAIAHVKATQLRSAVAEGEDPVVRNGADRYSLPRLEAPQSLTMLKSWTNGGFPNLSQRLFKRSWTRPY